MAVQKMMAAKVTEQHPWNFYIPAGSRVLIAGTFPSAKKNWKYEFFYPNPANLFWKMMARIAGIELKHQSGEDAVKERKKILDKLSVAITDMGKTINRYDDSSLDEKIEAVEYMDILNILEENPRIRKIIFTSSSGKVSAAKWFNEFLGSRNIKHTFPKMERPVKSEFEFNGRIIKLVIAYSPSPRAANRISFEKLVEIYEREIRELL